jgi:Mg2+ and Co2+ transporter CorA
MNWQSIVVNLVQLIFTAMVMYIVYRYVKKKGWFK